MPIIYVLNTNSRAPRQAYDSTGLDLYFNVPGEELKLWPGRTYQMDLGIRLYSLKGDNGSAFIIPRSSASKLEGEWEEEREGVSSIKQSSLELANTIGFIDWDYRGPVTARVNLNSSSPVEISLEKPYLQLVPQRADVNIRVVSSVEDIPEEYLATTTRGEGGYGSSDETGL